MPETRYVYASFWLDDGTLGVCLRPAMAAEVAELPPWYVVTVTEATDEKAIPSPSAPLAPWPAGMPVPITALDVTRALAAWDADVPAAAGLWAAQIVGRVGKARRKPV